MKVYYFEFPDQIVEAGIVPAKICSVVGRESDPAMFKELAMANRVFHIEGNTQVEIKNRYAGVCTPYPEITDEEKVLLVLKAVPIERKPRQ